MPKAISSAETIPHTAHCSGNFGSRPIRETAICHYAAQMLKFLIFILDGSLQPVITIQIQHNAALIKAVLTVKLRLDHKGEELLLCFHLQYRGVVIAKMVVSPLPQVCMWRRNDVNLFIGNGTGRGNDRYALL